MKSNLFLFLILSLVAFGCGESYLINEKVSFEESIWDYSDTVSFDFENQDSTKKYSLFLDVSYDEAYSYQNIYVKIHTNYPSGKKVSDQVGIDLSEKNGKSLGKCSSGTCTVPIVLVQNVKLAELGKHTFTFEQFTRDEKLEGLKSLSFKIQEVAQ